MSARLDRFISNNFRGDYDDGDSTEDVVIVLLTELLHRRWEMMPHEYKTSGRTPAPIYDVLCGARK